MPGTGSTPQTAFSWNYERAFAAAGRPFCAVTLPGSAMLDVQNAGQYVVNAIRLVHALAGRPIGILGWSQGGMAPRWALRFWPDTRTMVADMVALDPSNHGTLDAKASCTVQPSCAPAVWQQTTGAYFLAALNSGAETFGGIAYTIIYSVDDEVVVPNLDAAGSSSLHTGRGRIVNVAVQSVCPNDTSEHLAMGTYDAVGYALAIDALDHAGPANPARIPAAVCLQVAQPGVNPAMLAQNLAALDSSVVAAFNAAPQLPAEPALEAYVFK